MLDSVLKMIIIFLALIGYMYIEINGKINFLP
jgi:hypothetical protein